MKNLVLKENTAATLASIGVDKAASHIDVTAAQEFDVEMKKDSSVEESDGVPSDQDLEDDEKLQILKQLLTRQWRANQHKPVSHIRAQRTT